MAPKIQETPPVTTTTIAPSPATVPTVPVTTIPGTGDITADQTVWQQPGSTISYAGGINPSYKGLAADANYTGADKVKPYFYTNDDWQTILGYSPDKVIAVQTQLMKAFPGFVPGKVGDKRDAKTIAMFKKALGQINYLTQEAESPFRGKKLEDALAELTKTPSAASGKAKALPAYQMTSPTDLKAVFKKAAQDAIGRNLGEGDLNRLVEFFQSQQVTYQKQAAIGGPVVAPPSAETFATRSLEKDFGQEVNTQKLDGIFGAIDQALTGGQQ